eukprot:5709124-Amphidinium_carterae.1
MSSTQASGTCFAEYGSVCETEGGLCPRLLVPYTLSLAHWTNLRCHDDGSHSIWQAGSNCTYCDTLHTYPWHRKLLHPAFWLLPTPRAVHSKTCSALCWIRSVGSGREHLAAWRTRQE